MKTVIALFVTIRMIAGASEPVIDVLPGGFMSSFECGHMVRMRSADPQELEYDRQGRLILMKRYQCVYEYAENLEATLKTVGR
jgi:hypothetical protein